MKKRRATFLAGALLLAITPFLIANGTLQEASVAAADHEEIPLVGSYDNLKKLLQQEEAHSVRMYASPVMEGAVITKQAAPTPPAGDSSGAGAQVNYSTTNTQVQGVDEADIVKTDGTYLYQSTNKEVRIVKAFPADEMSIESRITYEDGLFSTTGNVRR